MLSISLSTYLIPVLNMDTVYFDRDIDKSICEMTCRLPMDPNILKKCIPYKYVVITPKSKRKRNTWYEFLHFSGKSGNPNRALILSDEKYQLATTKSKI